MQLFFLLYSIIYETSQFAERNERKMKRLVSIVAFLLVLLVSFSALGAEPVKFTDVDYNSEISKSIDKLVKGGVINGVPQPDGTFKYEAERNVTRGEFCKMINITFGYEIMANNIFTDINPSQWYYIHVLPAIHYGYIKGYGDGRFGGEDFITREQVCVILDRIVNKKSDKEITIKDAVSPWAEDAVKNIIGLGYMSLEEGETFRATVNMTRGELALALDDFVVIKVPEKEDTSGKEEKPSDTTSPVKPGGNSSTGSSKVEDTGTEDIGKEENTTPDPNPDPNPNPDPEPEPEPVGPTEEELAASENIYDNLYLALSDIEEKEELEVFSFDEKGIVIFNFLKTCSAEVYAKEAEGFVVSNSYVRSHYQEQISDITDILNGMTTEERDAFEYEVNKMNTVALKNLVELFDININYGKK